jgi:predicted nucleotidyltransferase component of viral defense system
MFPDEYILKFILDDVKIEFFCANRPIQKELLKQIEFTTYDNSRLKILDLKQIAKLKVIAFFQRDKIRDLFDFGAILENKIVSFQDILQISKELKNISSEKQLIKFILDKKEEKDDENVYLDEQSIIDLSFLEIKKEVLKKIEKIGNQKCKT